MTNAEETVENLSRTLDSLADAVRGTHEALEHLHLTVDQLAEARKNEWVIRIRLGSS